MPRTSIDLGLSLERLSILDDAGHVDVSLDPDVPAEDLRRLYRFLVLARMYDERRLRLQRQGRIGTFAPVQGQEAAQLGSVFAIERDDWVVPSFRELAVALWRGQKLEDDLLYCAGLDEGIRIPGDARDLPICIPVASQIPHAVGLAWGLKLRGSDRVVLCYFGDGATSEGDFHEALNFAGLHQVPVVFFCQNNQWAISVPRKDQTRARTLAQKAFAYDIPSIVVDGNDLLAVIVATREAVARARQGRGPTLIEAVTYRMGVHTTADDPTLYRGAAEVEAWRKRDPLARLRAYMQDRGILTDADEDAWRAEHERTIGAAVAAFEEAVSKVDPLQMFEHLYAEVPPHLRAQRETLRARAARRPRTTERETQERDKGKPVAEEEGPQAAGEEQEPPREEGASRRGRPRREARRPTEKAERNQGQAQGAAENEDPGEDEEEPREEGAPESRRQRRETRRRAERPATRKPPKGAAE